MIKNKKYRKFVSTSGFDTAVILHTSRLSELLRRPSSSLSSSAAVSRCQRKTVQSRGDAARPCHATTRRRRYTKRTTAGTMRRLLLLAGTLQMIAITVIQCRKYNLILPNVPDVLHPPVPSEAGISEDDAGHLQVMENIDPEVKPGLFQGDMALNNEIFDYWRVGLRWDIFPEKLWLNRTVPYLISPLYETEHRILIYQAIRTINFLTCIKFVPWTGREKDYLLIWPVKYPAGCWSYVGRYGGQQIVSLQPPDDAGTNCLGTDGRPIHELLHALGIFHEQSRADRDKFVKINLDNVIPQYRSNFDKQSLQNTTYQFEYDFDSVMHYGKNFFSMGKGKPTIIPKIDGKTIGQRKMMSKTDCLKINDLYGCLGKPPNYNYKYYTLCNYMGL